MNSSSSANDFEATAASTAPYGQTFDCQPSLTDRQVADFCREGYLILPSVVPDDINQMVVDYLDSVDDPVRQGTEPTPIMKQPWFVEGVLKNPQAAGAVRSLLGRNITLPVIISNHRGSLPNHSSGGWHRDGGTIYTHRLDYLQVFYYPEQCTPEMGPTEVLPGSHFLRAKANMMAHYGKIDRTVSTAAPAGSIFLTVYGIWHRRTRATVGPTGRSKFRNLLKYNYWRTTEPTRDWIIDPQFDFNSFHFITSTGVYFEQFQNAFDAAHLFCWLCGIGDQFQRLGGQCWPITSTVRDGTNQMGIPPALRTGSTED